jgi:hypothetical protein
LEGCAALPLLDVCALCFDCDFCLLLEDFELLERFEEDLLLLLCVLRFTEPDLEELDLFALDRPPLEPPPPPRLWADAISTNSGDIRKSDMMTMTADIKVR